jgi:hypothetical protein
LVNLYTFEALIRQEKLDVESLKSECSFSRVLKYTRFCNVWPIISQWKCILSNNCQLVIGTLNIPPIQKLDLPLTPTQRQSTFMSPGVIDTSSELISAVGMYFGLSSFLGASDSCQRSDWIFAKKPRAFGRMIVSVLQLEPFMPLGTAFRLSSWRPRSLEETAVGSVLWLDLTKDMQA